MLNPSNIKTMKILTDLVARILYIIPFVGLGFGHFTYTDGFAEMVPLPGAEIWVYLTGVAILAAAVSIIIKKKAALATLLLGVLLIIFVISIWIPMMGSEDEMQAQTGMTMMLKDLGLAGAAWFMSGVFRKQEEASE